MWRRLGGEGIEGKRKSSRGHGQQYGNCLWEETISGLIGKGKKNIKHKYRKKEEIKTTNYDLNNNLLILCINKVDSCHNKKFQFKKDNNCLGKL